MTSNEFGSVSAPDVNITDILEEGAFNRGEFMVENAELFEGASNQEIQEFWQAVDDKVGEGKYSEAEIISKILEGEV